MDSYGDFPVVGTETLWEGQGRAEKPLRIIWGFFVAGAHTVWADWRYGDVGPISDHRYGSIGRGWTPIQPLSEHLFQVDKLGVNCSGDEALKIAADILGQLEYWKMKGQNELVIGSAEAYCLAEPGLQYLIYAPKGGTVKLVLSSSNSFVAKWIDPTTGKVEKESTLEGGGTRKMDAPSSKDWVLLVTKSPHPQLRR